MKMFPIAKKIGYRGKWRHGLDEDDVCQNAMLRIMDRMDVILSAEYPMQFAKTIAVGTILDMIQYNSQKKRSSIDYNSDDEAQWPSQYVDPMFDKGVRDGLSKVNNSSAMALKLVWEHGYSRKEISEMSGIPTTNISRMVTTAYAAVADQLGLPAPPTRDRRDTSVYLFRNDSGEEVRTTRKGLMEMGLSASDVFCIIRDGRTRKGWSLIK